LAGVSLERAHAGNEANAIERAVQNNNTALKYATGSDALLRAGAAHLRHDRRAMLSPLGSLLLVFEGARFN